MPSLDPEQDGVREAQPDTNPSTKPPLVVLLGPTGVGKSEIAIQLVHGFDGEIVSSDSRLLYRAMDIGTAKPSEIELQTIPHHLINVADPDQVWSLAMYQQAARKAIDDIHSRNKLPFLVGGTGQYIYAIIEAWEPPKVKPNQELRTALQNWANLITTQGLHRRLGIIDPDAASNIEERNLRRTIRALEVIFSTGIRFSAQRKRNSPPYRTLLLGMTRPREELYTRIDERVEKMIQYGLIDEVKSLLDNGYSPDLPTFSAIGYKEIIVYLQGKTNLTMTIQNIKRNTRVYVRRQANWFKPDDPDIHWFDANERTLEMMSGFVKEWLSSLKVNS